MGERIVLSINADSDTVFSYDARAEWWMDTPEEREATVIENELLRRLAAVERERDAAIREVGEQARARGYAEHALAALTGEEAVEAMSRHVYHVYTTRAEIREGLTAARAAATGVSDG